MPESLGGLAGSDLIVIDAPALTERGAQRVLRLADGMILTCLADPLSLRTIPRAAQALQQARVHNPRLALLGVQIAVYHEQDDLQAGMLQLMRQTLGPKLLEPPVPAQAEIGDWALEPGSPLPDGPARESYRALANMLEEIIANVTPV